MSTARLTFASTATSTDAYFIAGMTVADAFVGFELRGKFYAVASSLELGNFRKYSRCDRVRSLESLRDQLGGKASMAGIIALAVKTAGGRRIVVGEDFPAGLFLQLKTQLKKVAAVSISKGALFPERAVKTAEQINEIRKANRGVAAGIALCEKALRASKIKNGKLFYEGKALTSEFLRGKVQELFLHVGLEPGGDLIIAGGAQGCDPHCQGHGVLRANELIIVDLFAPLQATHYWGDMTRTFLRGTPNDAQAKLVAAVAKAQKTGIRAIKPGITGAEVHAQVAKILTDEDYQTKRTKNGYEGFFHGTGHSLGLDCHDMVRYGYRLGGSGNRLQVNEVYTVEPGLYYPAIGGCRIEDNGVVTEKGFQLISKAPYDWVV